MTVATAAAASSASPTLSPPILIPANPSAIATAATALRASMSLPTSSSSGAPGTPPLHEDAPARTPPRPVRAASSADLPRPPPTVVRTILIDEGDIDQAGSRSAGASATPRPPSAAPTAEKAAEATTAAPAAEPASVRRAGWLTKKNDLLPGGTRAQLRAWRQYWVEVAGTTMYFYDDTPSPARRGERVVGTLCTKNVVISFDYTKRKHVFVVAFPDQSRYLFRCASDDELKEWVRAIGPVRPYMHGAPLAPGGRGQGGCKSDVQRSDAKTALDATALGMTCAARVQVAAGNFMQELRQSFGSGERHGGRAPLAAHGLTGEDALPGGGAAARRAGQGQVCDPGRRHSRQDGGQPRRAPVPAGRADHRPGRPRKRHLLRMDRRCLARGPRRLARTLRAHALANRRGCAAPSRWQGRCADSEGTFTDRDVVFEGRNRALLSDEFQKTLPQEDPLELPRSQLLRRHLSTKGSLASPVLAPPNYVPPPSLPAASGAPDDSASPSLSRQAPVTPSTPAAAAASASASAAAAGARPPTLSATTLVPAQPFSSAAQLAAFLNPPVTAVRGSVAASAVATGVARPAGATPGAAATAGPPPSTPLPPLPGPPPQAVPASGHLRAGSGTASPAKPRDRSGSSTAADAGNGAATSPAAESKPARQRSDSAKGARAAAVPTGASPAPAQSLSRQQQIAEIRRKKKASIEQFRRLTEELSKVPAPPCARLTGRRCR